MTKKKLQEEDYGNIFPEAHKKACEEWEKTGGAIVQGTDTTLLLDIDTQEDFDKLEERLKMLNCILAMSNYGRAHIIEKYQSKSGGVHVIIKLDKGLDKYSRVLLQACLGSDLKRELYSFGRLLNQVKEPSVLFKPANSTLRVTKK